METDSLQTVTSLTQEHEAYLFEARKRIAALDEEKARNEVTRTRMEMKRSEIELIKARGGGNAALVAANLSHDDDEGEIPPEIKPVTIRFPGLPQDQIVKIYANKFKPINLFRLYRDRGFRNEEEDQIHVVDGFMKMKKVRVTLKNYDSSFYEIWFETFQFYSKIMNQLFGKTSPDLLAALLDFRTRILDLSEVYEWQEVVLPLAMDAHTHILTTHPTEASSWVIRPGLQEFYCTSLVVLSVRRTGPKSDSSKAQRRSRFPKIRPSAPNDKSVVCENFNKGICNYSRCEKTHRCKKCGDSEHGLTTCKKA